MRPSGLHPSDRVRVIRGTDMRLKGGAYQVARTGETATVKQVWRREREAQLALDDGGTLVTVPTNRLEALR